MKLYEVCRCRREALGYNETQVAHMMSIPVVDYIQFENGECNNPMVEKYIADNLTAMMKNLDKEQYLKVKMMSIMLEIRDEPVTDKLLLETSYLLQAASDLNTHLIRKKKEESKNNENYINPSDSDFNDESDN